MCAVYDSYHQTMNTYDIMFQDKCINMTYDRDNINIMCNPDAFHFLNGIVSFILSSGMGFYLAFLFVSHFIYNAEHYNYTNEELEGVNEETVITDEQENFIKMYDTLFDSLPKYGYEIKSYPFTYKLEDKTPYGDIIMFLNVYKDDYLENSESIEYTYYSQSNAWTFSQLSVVAKKIGIELNTKQFYKDKTIQYGVKREELIAEKNKVNNNETTGNAEITKNNESIGDVSGLIKNDEENNKSEAKEEKSVFAKFKSYNKGSMGGNIVKSSTNTNSGNEEDESKYDNLIEPSRIRRLGTLEEYKIELLKNEVKKRMKNISFGDFKTKSKKD